MRPKLRSTYSTIPPEMGMAAVSSPNTAPMGTRKMAPRRNAIIAGTGPPPTTIQSPTCSTQPVPMMAPKPMVKKFHRESVFFMPPSPGLPVAFVSAMFAPPFIGRFRARHACARCLANLRAELRDVT